MASGAGILLYRQSFFELLLGMKTAILCLDINPKSRRRNEDLCIDSQERYATAINSDFVLLRAAISKIHPTFDRFNHLKTFLRVYDRVLILDRDIIIRRGVPNVFEHLNAPLAMTRVGEFDAPVRQWGFDELRSTYQLTDKDFHYDDGGFPYYYCCGMMLASRDALDFFEVNFKEELYRPSLRHEQAYFNWVYNRVRPQILDTTPQWHNWLIHPSDVGSMMSTYRSASN
jgi:hypothetical protein